MKKLILSCGILTCLLFAQPLQAQLKVNVNINLQPTWGPVGYDYVEYYYLPDVEMYYSVPRKQYVYLSNGKWLWVSSLPKHCRNYNIQTGYKVVINESNPFSHYGTHKTKYAKYKNHYGKQKNRGNGNGNGNGNGKGNGNGNGNGNGHGNKGGGHGNGNKGGGGHGNGGGKHGKGHH